MSNEPRSTSGSAGHLVALALRRPSEVLALPATELDLTLRLMRRARLLGRLAYDLTMQGLLEDAAPVVTDQLQSALVVAEARARVARWEMDRVAWTLRDLADVPLVALKGCGYLLAGTPNARGRTFADVDLLVPEDRLPAVEARLREGGWRPAELTDYDERYYRAWAHELPPLRHPEREVEVDLHHGILMRTARLRPSSALLFEAARPIPGSRFKVLAPVDMVLHAIVHLFHGGEMDDALRELVDIDDLMQHYAATVPGFWRQFWERADALDLARPAYYGLRYAARILGTPLPDSVTGPSRAGAPASPARWVMDRCVPKALFPQHPDRPSSLVPLARLILYMRAHWLKMPPLMLARHLSYKFYVRLFQPGMRLDRGP